ncbi:DUF2384 domain-containing protein [Pseudothauera nasutitermitis]|uniref:DUF2384 domain-containing protein n=1 Tax=Pseudothauera nasutitermitis TaxID=2565930 RepID=A0A4S4B1Z8_9RHOO|nr:MbcA/ParS/Xre antitoxin family protein [Pseudothauera nasutitermitis]THF66614.1 DUF2384 domain-containing protein [Pseudothauera nasutitermitis]
MPATQARTRPDAAAVLTKATVRAAELLGLKAVDLAVVLGVSESSVTRLKRGGRLIEQDTREGEFALLLIRVFRSLDPLVGGDDAQRKRWMHTHNRALNGIPAELVRRVEGLARTLNYLDGMRAPA